MGASKGSRSRGIPRRHGCAFLSNRDGHIQEDGSLRTPVINACLPSPGGQTPRRAVMAAAGHKNGSRAGTAAPRAYCQRFGRLLVIMAGVILLVAARPVRAASSASSSGEICDIDADYALGVEDYPKAVRLHQDILRRNPNNALAHYHLGFAYGMDHDGAGELREYLRAKNLGLRQWDLFLNLGLVYFERGDSRSAVEAFATATELGPQHSEAHFNLGLAYERAGRLQEAISELSASLRLKPEQPEAENSLAVVYAETGDYAHARALWEKLDRIGYQPARANIAILDHLATDRAAPAAQVSITGLAQIGEAPPRLR